MAVGAGAVAYALLARGNGHLAQPARAGAPPAVGPQAFRPGQFWYTRTITSQHQWMPAGGMTIDRRGYVHWRGPHVLFDLRVSEETWVGVDGTIRDRMIVAGVRFAYPADRARWAAHGRPVPNFNHLWLGWMSHDSIAVGGDRFPARPWYPFGGEWLGPSGWDVGDSLFSYRQLLSLPTQPAALRARVRQAERRLARREARTGAHGVAGPGGGAFGALGDIAGLLASPLPAADRRALLDALATMPGATVDRHARDSLGRPGVAVSASSGPAFGRMIFDPATGALLENAPHVAVVAQGVVDSASTLPRGISPIRPAGAPSQPQTPAISPAVGNPTTAFRLKIPARGQARRAPALDWLLIGTPPARCFAGFLPRLPPLVASAGIRVAGKLTYVYRLGPADLHRDTWCAGRYELGVVPAYSPRAPSSQLGPDALPGASVYFQVK